MQAQMFFGATGGEGGQKKFQPYPMLGGGEEL